MQATVVSTGAIRGVLLFVLGATVAGALVLSLSTPAPLSSPRLLGLPLEPDWPASMLKSPEPDEPEWLPHEPLLLLMSLDRKLPEPLLAQSLPLPLLLLLAQSLPLPDELPSIDASPAFGFACVVTLAVNTQLMSRITW